MHACKAAVLVICFLVLWIHGECAAGSMSDCPTWTYPTRNNECVCGSHFGYILVCITDMLVTTLNVDFYCVFFSEEFDTTLIASCPYGSRGILPRNVSELSIYCQHLHRKGELCGECEDNYTLPVYSYYLGCVKCEDYKYGWVKFIAAAFLPLTLFYFIVIVFRISATSPTLNGYILVSQIVATPTMMQLLYTFEKQKMGSKVAQEFFKVGIAVYSVWNLDFFRSFYEHLCLYPNITYQQVLILDYAVAVYPLLLILITYILVKLHDNFAIVVWLWRPFHKCLVLFRKQWNIRSYLINALTTFIVLSYVKILNVSFQFLTFSQAYNMTHVAVNKAYWYYDGSVDLASKDYIPYLILAVLMLVIFNIVPLVLLFLYPFKCFQICLNKFTCTNIQLTLQIFMDTFHGCYKHNMRHFAALYLAVRVLNLLFLSVFHYSLYFKMNQLIFVITLALVAKYQPNKCSRSNRVDVVMLIAVICIYLFLDASIADTTDDAFRPRWLTNIVPFISVFIPPSYAAYLAVVQVLPPMSYCHKLIKRSTIIVTKILKFKAKEPSNGSDEEEALLDNKASIYN